MVRIRVSGFTLVEILFVLTVLSILVLIAISGFLDLLRANHLTTQANRFIVAAQLARNEAIKQNQKVMFCARNGGQCSGTEFWESGWIVFADVDGDGQPDQNEVIGDFEPVARGYSLRPNFKTTQLSFFGDGRVRRDNALLPMATFRICAPDAVVGKIKERSKEVTLNAAGRMRLQSGREGKTQCP